MLSFQSPKSIQKEEHNSQRIKVQDGSAQASRGSSKCQEYRRVLVGTQAGYRRISTFRQREIPVRRENIFSRRGAACGQRVTTHKMSSRRDGLKSEEKRGRRKPLASSLPLGVPLVPRSSRVKHLQSPQKPRAGNASRPQDVISESRTRVDGRRVTARYVKWVSARQE